MCRKTCNSFPQSPTQFPTLLAVTFLMTHPRNVTNMTTIGSSETIDTVNRLLQPPQSPGLAQSPSVSGTAQPPGSDMKTKGRKKLR